MIQGIPTSDSTTLYVTRNTHQWPHNLLCYKEYPSRSHNLLCYKEYPPGTPQPSMLQGIPTGDSTTFYVTRNTHQLPHNLLCYKEYPPVTPQPSMLQGIPTSDPTTLYVTRNTHQWPHNLLYYKEYPPVTPQPYMLQGIHTSDPTTFYVTKLAITTLLTDDNVRLFLFATALYDITSGITFT